MKNPFKLFGLEPIFEINETQLAATFRNLQRAVHPDRYVNASDQERRWALEQAAAVNQAYQILRDPIQRARYLLTLHGIIIEDQNTLIDPNFLIEQIDLRERLEEIRRTADPFINLNSVKLDLNKRRTTLISELSKCLSSSDQKALINASDIVQRLRFFERLIEEARSLEDHYLDKIIIE